MPGRERIKYMIFRAISLVMICACWCVSYIQPQQFGMLTRTMPRMLPLISKRGVMTSVDDFMPLFQATYHTLVCKEIDNNFLIGPTFSKSFATSFLVDNSKISNKKFLITAQHALSSSIGCTISITPYAHDQKVRKKKNFLLDKPVICTKKFTDLAGVEVTLALERELQHYLKAAHLPRISFGQLNRVRKDDQCFLIGYPQGGYEIAVVPACIRGALLRHRGSVVEVPISAALCERNAVGLALTLSVEDPLELRGMSGGAIVNVEGELIGVVSRLIIERPVNKHDVITSHVYATVDTVQDLVDEMSECE